MLFIITKETISKMKSILESYPDIDTDARKDLLNDLDNLHPLNALMTSSNSKIMEDGSCRN